VIDGEASDLTDKEEVKIDNDVDEGEEDNRPGIDFSITEMSHY
jgi:hypothetical protein